MINTAKKIKLQRGMTMIEMLIYISLVSLMTIIFTNFTIDIIKSSSKALAMKEVNQNVRFIMSRITQELKTATDLESVTTQNIIVKNYEGESVSFKFDSVDHEIIYNDGVDDHLISNGVVKVNNLIFTQIADNVIKINLEVESLKDLKTNRPYSFDLVTYVSPRSPIY